MNDSPTSKTQFYELVGLTYKEAREIVADRWSGFISNGHAFMSDELVLRPMGCNCEHCRAADEPGVGRAMAEFEKTWGRPADPCNDNDVNWLKVRIYGQQLARAAQPPSVQHEAWCDRNCDCGANYRSPSATSGASAADASANLVERLEFAAPADPGADETSESCAKCHYTKPCACQIG